MSVGHRRSNNDTNWLWSDEELKEAEEFLEDAAKLDTDHDIPYTAGYSKNAKTVYIDQEVPQFIKVKAAKYVSNDTKEVRKAHTIMIDLYKTFRMHELIEKSLEDEPYWLPYILAHQLALRIEQAYVEALGADWDDYNTKTIAIVDKIYARKKFPNIPKDLDKEPYTVEDDTKILDQFP